MRELEQKTKDCWDGNYQFQEDRSAQYRESPKHARRRAKQVMYNATRGGKDVCLQIPVIDVRLRFLADPPKMEWSRRRASTASLGVPEENGEEAAAAATISGRSLGQSASVPNTASAQNMTNSRQDDLKRGRGSPARPPPPMVAVTKFNQKCFDMSNPKHLYNMLHGRVGGGTATKKVRKKKHGFP
jgi:hypothetical protein